MASVVSNDKILHSPKSWTQLCKQSIPCPFFPSFSLRHALLTPRDGRITFGDNSRGRSEQLNHVHRQDLGAGRQREERSRHADGDGGKKIGRN